VFAKKARVFPPGNATIFPAFVAFFAKKNVFFPPLKTPLFFHPSSAFSQKKCKKCKKNAKKNAKKMSVIDFLLKKRHFCHIS